MLESALRREDRHDEKIVGVDDVGAHLIESGKLDPIDRSLVEQRSIEEQIDITGLNEPSNARRLGELLGVKYIVYGNVNDVTLSDGGTEILSSGVTVCTVKAHLSMRMLNVETGADVDGRGRAQEGDTGQRAQRHQTVGIPSR